MTFLHFLFWLHFNVNFLIFSPFYCLRLDASQADASLSHHIMPWVTLMKFDFRNPVWRLAPSAATFWIYQSESDPKQSEAPSFGIFGALSRESMWALMGNQGTSGSQKLLTASICLARFGAVVSSGSFNGPDVILRGHRDTSWSDSCRLILIGLLWKLTRKFLLEGSAWWLMFSHLRKIQQIFSHAQKCAEEIFTWHPVRPKSPC